MPLKFLDFIERESSVSRYYKKSSKKNIKNIYMTKRFFYNAEVGLRFRRAAGNIQYLLGELLLSAFAKKFTIIDIVCLSTILCEVH
jgi:hypothetical protein